MIDKNILISFGTQIKLQRKLLNLTQEDLSNKTGLHRTYIGMIERGEKNITLKNIEKIAFALNIKISTLLAEMEKYNA